MRVGSLSKTISPARSQRARPEVGAHDTNVIVDRCAVFLNVPSTNFKKKSQSAIFRRKTKQMGTQQAALGREQLAICSVSQSPHRWRGARFPREYFRI